MDIPVNHHPQTPSALKQVPTDKIVRPATGAPDANQGWMSRISDVRALDILACRADLRAAGYDADILAIADHLVDDRATLKDRRERRHDELLYLPIVGLSAIVLATALVLIDPEGLGGPVAAWAAVGTSLVAGALVAAGVWFVRPHPAATIIRRHTTRIKLPNEDRNVLLRASRAIDRVRSTSVWNFELFDTHRVRVDLDEEFHQLTTRLRRLASITHGTEPDEATRNSTEALRATTARRVEALERYAGEVADCEKEVRRLTAIDTRTSTADRLNDLLASTDQRQIAHLEGMIDDSRAIAGPVREALTVMAETAADLTPAGDLSPAQGTVQQ